MPNSYSIEEPEDRSNLQQAVEAFLAANGEEEMNAVVEEFPFVGDEHFAGVLEQMLDHAARAGEPEAMFHLQNQVALLEETLGYGALSAVEQAIEDFLYAEDDDVEAVFAQNASLLRSDEAAQLLFAMEAGDAESHLLLEERRLLWRRLVGNT